MPTLFTHGVVAFSLGQTGDAAWRRDANFWWMAVLCSILPDADVVGFRFGIHYGDLWGHRGMTHSLLFAAVLGALAAACLRKPWREWCKLALFLAAITASHGVLDAMTNGGLGIAFFSPFNTERYFFPWRPIQVSPIAARGFFSLRGMNVLRSEFCWVWGPSLALALALLAWRLWHKRRRQAR
ncbi:MAG TPA: metal-dependent hydrolase [Alphaproteobacteria bacterium]|nr:metal-dependent hydrolase [Alphaproteobacteria bacterium]